MGKLITKGKIPVYPMDGVKVDTRFYAVFELKRKYDISDKRLVLDSDFQREDVWGKEKKAELVESVLMGLPLPIFYFNQDRYGRLIVVDGRQRLTALFEFLDNRISLVKLKVFPEFNGARFSDLPSVMQSRLEDFQVHAHVILPPTPDRVKFEIYERVNRGGMKLNQQEMRNALYQGKATKLLGELAGCEAFKLATGNAFEKEKRMKDRYLLTRLAACYFLGQGMILDDEGQAYAYKGDLEDLLGRTMDTINGMTDGDISSLAGMIKDALKKSYDYLGGDGFRLICGERRSPINMNVFETVMLAMLWIPPKKEDICHAVREKILRFVGSSEFRANIGNHRDSAKKLYWRLEQAEQLGRLFEQDDQEDYR